MLNAIILSNGIHAVERSFPAHPRVHYRVERLAPDRTPDLSGAGLVIVPNGSDHVALARQLASIHAFLEAGGALFCFDGWFTDWVPGNHWIMDNSKRTKDIRYYPGTDRHGLLDGVDLDELIFKHGISGWWACGHIRAAPGADTVLGDTWERSIVVLDEVTTPGTLFLTASGPLPAADRPGDLDYGPNRLYNAALELVERRSAMTVTE